MKILLLSALLCLPVTVFAQMQPPPPTTAQLAAGAESSSSFKGANVITITTADSASVALVKLGRAFQANGVTVERLDKDLLSISTKPKVLSNGLYLPEATYLAVATPGANSVLTITGQGKAEGMGAKVIFPVEIKGTEKGPPTSAFRLMELTAKAYPGGRVGYMRKL